MRKKKSIVSPMLKKTMIDPLLKKRKTLLQRALSIQQSVQDLEDREESEVETPQV